MENKLLFNSGSWAVGSEGKKAVVELGKVLGDNPDISVLMKVTLMMIVSVHLVL
jgi:chemotaxis protein MotB